MSVNLMRTSPDRWKYDGFGLCVNACHGDAIALVRADMYEG